MNYKQVILLLVLVVGILWTSGHAKLTVETSMWPAGVRLSSYPGELNLFVALKDLPVGTKVYQYGNPIQHFPIAFEKDSCGWCEEEYYFNEDLINKTPDNLYYLLKENNYEYLIISPMTFAYMSKRYDAEQITKHIDNLLLHLQNSTNYLVALNTQAGLILKVN